MKGVKISDLNAFRNRFPKALGRVWKTGGARYSALRVMARIEPPPVRGCGIQRWNRNFVKFALCPVFTGQRDFFIWRQI